MKWFYNLSIAKKLFYGFSALLTSMILIGLFAAIELSKINTNAVELDGNWVPSIKYMGKLVFDIGKVRRNELVSLMSMTQEEVIKNEKDLGNLEKVLADDKADYEKILSGEQQIILYNEFNEYWVQYQAIRQSIIALTKENRMPEAIALNRGESKKVYDIAEQKLFQLSKLCEQGATVSGDEIHRLTGSSQYWIFLLLGINVLLGIIIASIVSKYIKSGIAQVAERIESLSNLCISNLAKGSEQLAEGDLAISFIQGTKPLEITTSDEIGKLARTINLVIKNTQATIRSVEKAVDAIRGTIAESQKLVEAASEGNLKTRSNPESFKGSYRELIVDLNATLNAIVEPITESGDVLAELSRGDLTIRMTGNYKGDFLIIKNSINTVAESLSAALAQVDESVMATASAAAQISSSSEVLASGAQEQNVQTNEIAGAVEEMTKTILESTRNAGIAAEHSKSASDSAKIGARKIEESKHGMIRIVNSTKETGKIIFSLTQKTDQIGEITQVIDDIADQTNLLALNAAIEAARAGDQGRGFAVVADEVRKLAERTTKATKEIAETIRTVQREAKEADRAMVEAEDLVKTGMDLTEEVAKVLAQILTMNERVAETVIQLAASSEQQSATAEEISKNIETITTVVSESANGTGQIARAAEDLNGLTDNLQALLGQFRIENNHRENNKSAKGYDLAGKRLTGIQNN